MMNARKGKVHAGTGQAFAQAKTRAYFVVSSADVDGPVISGAERQQAHVKRHKKAMEAIRRHREELAI